VSHRRQGPAVRVGLLVFRAARMGVLLAVVPALVVLVVWLCFAGDPAP